MEPDRPPFVPSPHTDRRVLVGLDLAGETLRYAAVAHVPSRPPELIRLGTATFAHDVAASVFDPAAGAEGGRTLGRIAHDALRGERPYALHLVAHAPHLPSYFVPVAEGLPAAERYDRLRRETLLLADAAPESVLRVRSRPVRLAQLPREIEGAMVWHRTLHIPTALHERMDRLARHVGAVGRGGARYEIVDGAEAAAVLVLEAEGEVRRGGLALSLAVGLYETGAELGICQGGRLYHSRRIEAGPGGAGGLMDDVAYFATALLASLQLDAEQLDRVYLYGPHASAAAVDGLAELFAADTRVLGGATPFEHRLGTIDPAFVPAIGAALAEL